MNTLDTLYEKCFSVNKKYIKTIIDDRKHAPVIKISNVFDNPDLVLKFQKYINKWESSGSSKPGIMGIGFPYWTANHIFKEIFKVDLYEYRKESETEFIYFYKDNACIDEQNLNNLASNNCLLPHTDGWIEPDSIKRTIIMIVNLNKKKIKTGFWKFLNYDNDYLENQNDYFDYTTKITYENIDEYTNNGVLDKKFDVEYSYNEGIIYYADMYHQPIIEETYSRENPRILFRITCNIDIEDSIL